RLLGKAFLESQKYTEASDILQRVLSVFPDDFISQIGMSIVREDEGNLDAAIWHMERAFEVQPANNAVQDELKRLYGRRDGVAPAKVRLTSGALIRMYARGDLYAQAISEILAVMKDDPKRQDLEVILARMYYLSDQKQKSVQVCYNIVSKLPYCYEANRILTELLPQFDKTEEAKAFQKRLSSLDPYASMLSSLITNSADVNDEGVLIEKLEYISTQNATTQQPDWAKSIGVQWTDADDVKPEWLDTSGTIDAQPSESVDSNPMQPAMAETFETDELKQEDSMTDQGGNEESQKENLPNWMASAGWGVSDQENALPSEQSSSEPVVEPEEIQASGILPAEIPDWLKSIAPADSQPENVEKEDLGSLENIFSNAPEINTVPENNFSANLPEEMNVSEESLPQPENELPDWLKNLSSSEEQDNAASPDLPDWLKDMDEKKISEVAPADESSLPDWLADKETESAQIVEASNFSVETIQTPEPISFTEENLSATVSENPDIQEKPAEMSEEDSEFAWLESLAAKQGASAETLITNPLDRSDTIPEWLTADKDTEAQPAVDFIQEPEQILPTTSEIADDSNLPDWLAEAIAEETPAAEIDAAVIAEQEFVSPTANVTPDWLPEEVLQTIEESTATIEPVASEPTLPKIESDDDLPEWLRTEIEDTRQLTNENYQPAPTIETPAPIQEQVEPVSQNGDIDSALAWLETLAEKQGADKETLFVPPDQRLSEPPEWIQEATQSATPEQLTELTPVLSDDVEITPAKPEVTANALPPLPDWLQVLQESSDAKEQVDFSGVVDKDFELPTPPTDATYTPPAAYEGVVMENNPEAMAENEIAAPIEIFPTTSDETLVLSEMGDYDQAPVSPVVEVENVVPEAPEIGDTQPSHILEQQILEPVAEISQLEQTAADGEDMLDKARQALLGNDLPTSVDLYSQMVQSNDRLPDVIKDIKEALYSYPVDIDLWQLFGDALANDNQINEALEAYSKAESLLK
ncbi:MAG: hypothetical protein HGA86_00910, partial [Anaerolineaceae bacterium]|nr:hypothetical protein [Anaerolineaceae bacterium]